MKKKIATLLMFLFSCLGVLTGCNLFSTNNYAGLKSVVATSGDIEITRDQLVSAFNSSGYQYTQYYGYTMEQALTKTIDDLINREYMLRYIDEKAQTDATLRLTDKEVYDVILETWEYIDASLESIANNVRKELGLTVEEEEAEESSDSSSEEEFKGYTPYTTKFKLDTATGLVAKVMQGGENSYVPEITEDLKYQYTVDIDSDNEDFKAIVWNRYISQLKKNQSIYKYPDTSDKKTFNREIEQIYKSNLENAKLQKYQNVYTATFGVDFNVQTQNYYLNDSTLTSMLSKYKEIYDANKQFYNLTKNSTAEKNPFYSNLTNSTNRANYLYYGEGEEELITCLHILVKFSEDQTTKIKDYEADPYVQGSLESILKDVKSQSKTFATERNPKTGEVVEGENTISVEEMFNMLLTEISNIEVSYTNEQYIERVTEIFNKYIYTYNQDTGIMNATYDYVVGTKTSQMVNSFTEVVRKLYNNGEVDYDLTESEADYKEDVKLYFPKGVGYAGAVSAPFLEEASNYSGYHIVLYTGTLKSVSADSLTIENLFEKLSKVKTSVSYNQTIFELMYDKVAKDNYNQHQSDVLATIKKATKYDSSNYSDLY